MSMPPRSRTGSGPVVAGLITIAVVLVTVGVLAAAGITPQRAWDSFFPVGGATPVTDRAVATKALYDIVFYIAVAIFLIVETMIVFTVLRYRRKPGDEALPPQIHGNNLVEVIWTAIPTAIVLLLFVMSWQTLNTVEAKPPSEVHVRAVAARYQWRFDYLDANGATLFSQALPVGEEGGMFLPVGEPITVTLKADDVIHAFYVPRFLFKRDAVPGKENVFSFTVEEAGTYRGQCAELCGAFHGSMIFDVHAIPKADFEAWLAEDAARSLDAKPGKDSNVIAISYTARDPVVAAKVANAHNFIVQKEEGYATLRSRRGLFPLRPLQRVRQAGSLLSFQFRTNGLQAAVAVWPTNIVASTKGRSRRLP